MKLSYIAFGSLAIAVLSLFTLTACVDKKQKAPKDSGPFQIAVFVPGTVSGSPVYEMLVSGVKKAVTEAVESGMTVTVDIVEAGTKQADWGTKLTSLVADGTYKVIITSNPAMPEIIEPISRQFPEQNFLALDAYAEGNPHLTTIRYNQREQAYISGHMAALVSSSQMKFANASKKIGLIAGQEYPAMTGIILPAFLEGAQAVDPAFEVDFRIVGNWYDAAKGAELAKAMHKAGVDVIMPVSGGANQGVIAAAGEAGFYIAWFDDNGYAKAPGLVISSAVMAQERLAYEQTRAIIEGKLTFGLQTTVGIADTFIDFVANDPLYIETVSADLRAKQAALMARLTSGELTLPVK